MNHFARSCCSITDDFAPQIFLYFTFICPLKSSKEFLLEIDHSNRLAADQIVIDMSRDIDVLFMVSTLWSHPN
jgi:hypothetical protein